MPQQDLNNDLLAAAETGDAATVRALLAKGADVNSKDSKGQTPLILAAASFGHADTVQALLSAGADINAQRGMAGETALMLAVLSGDADTVQALLDFIEILTLRHYSTYHVVNNDRCSYYDFALEAGRVLKIADSELMQLIEPVNLCALRHNAKRPRYTPMRCIVSEEIGLAPLRDWRRALAEYIHDEVERCPSSGQEGFSQGCDA